MTNSLLSNNTNTINIANLGLNVRKGLFDKRFSNYKSYKIAISGQLSAFLDRLPV